jgi:hypothetical protein
MNEIRQCEMFEEIRQKRINQFKEMDDKIKVMSEEEKDLLYQKIIKDEEEVKRKKERDIKIYNYLLNQVNNQEY